jgi:hypothetical protein
MKSPAFVELEGLQLKMEGLPSHKQIILLISSQHVSAQIGHRQVIFEEYTNDGGIHINYVQC